MASPVINHLKIARVHIARAAAELLAPLRDGGQPSYAVDIAARAALNLLEQWKQLREMDDDVEPATDEEQPPHG
jgi:hypothetical protein